MAWEKHLKGNSRYNRIAGTSRMCLLLSLLLQAW